MQTIKDWPDTYLVYKCKRKKKIREGSILYYMKYMLVALYFLICFYIIYCFIWVMTP